MPRKLLREKGITRVDHRRTHAYMVRIPWKGEIFQRMFSDGRYGDRLAAYAAAVEWRNKKEQEIGKPHTSRMVIARPPRAKKPEHDTGVVGIRRVVKDGTARFEVSWMKQDGGVGRTSYSIANWGEAEAFKKAKRKRRQMERQRLMLALDQEARQARRRQQLTRREALDTFAALADYIGAE